MMFGLIRQLDQYDREMFNWLYQSYAGSWTGEFFALMGNPVFWAPLLTFLAVMIAAGNPRKGMWYVGIGLICFLITSQAADLISFFVDRMPPYAVLYKKNGFQLPAFQQWIDPSFPDWASAALFSVVYYSFRMARFMGVRMYNVIWVIVPLFLIARVVAGYAFPFDVVAGYLVGWGMGVLFVKFANSLGLLLGWQDTAPERRKEDWS